MIIYKITNKINNKIYIGQTIQPLVKRWKQHCRHYKHRCTSIYNAIQKYGKENFIVEQIDHAHSREELDNKEMFWIEFYNSMNREKGYNLVSGGNKNHTVSDETRKRMSEANKGDKNFFYGKGFLILGQNNHFYGKHHSEDAKRKISEALRGNKNHNFGRPMSDKTKRKISESRKGKLIGSDNPKSSKVLCIETGEVFDCGLYACDKYNISAASLCNCLKRRSKTAGKLHWVYVYE